MKPILLCALVPWWFAFSLLAQQSPPAGKPRVQRSAAVASGAAQRNENVQVNRIDNNAVKEALVRLGASATVVDAPTPGRNFYGTEFGKAPSEVPFLPKAS